MTRAAEPQKALAETARGGLIGLAGAIIAAGGGFALTVVVARALGPVKTGVFFIVVALITIVGEITELGADTGLVRQAAAIKGVGRIGELRGLMRTALIPPAIASVAAAIALVLLADPLAELLVDVQYRDDAELFLLIGGPAVAIWALRNVALAGTRGLGSVTAFTLVNNIAMPAGRPLLVLVCLIAGWSAWTVMLAWVLPAVLGSAAALYLLWRVLRRVETVEAAQPARPKAEVSREFWSFSGPRGVAAALEIGIVWLDVLIVGVLVSTREAGLYATTSRFITTGTLMLAAARIAVAPQISAMLARGERREAERLNGIATTWIVAGSWPIYLLLAIGGPFVLTLFGPEFAEGATALAVLCAAMLVALLAGNVQTVLLMGGKSTWSLANKAVAIVVMIIADILLIPPYGIVGAAFAWGLTILVDNGLAALQVRYGMGLRLWSGATVVVACGAAVCFGGIGLATRATTSMTALPFMLFAAASCAVYGLVLVAMRRHLHLEAFLGGRKIGHGR